MSDPICNERGIPQSECPPFCPHDFGRLESYVAEYVNDSPATLRVRLTEAESNALEMARKAEQAERRAEEAEFHVEQLRDARDRAERRIEQIEALADEWQEDYPSDLAACSRTADQWWRDLRAALGVERFDDAPCGPGCEPDHCDHEDCHHRHQWLDRPESDTRECLICGAEVAG